MFGKFLIGGVTAAVILGAGTAALAVSGSDSTATSGSGTHAKQHGNAKGKHKAGKLLRRAQHAQIVTKGKDGFVTHDLIKGTVTAVSATSITVKSADAKTETFAITKDTKVRSRSDGKASDSTISKVTTGDLVFVGGTGTSTFTAKHVVEHAAK